MNYVLPSSTKGLQEVKQVQHASEQLEKRLLRTLRSMVPLRSMQALLSLSEFNAL